MIDSPVEWCIHAANLFYLASFLGRDMLRLRILTCCGLGLGIVFFACQPAPMYGPSAWHAVFLVINGFQIARLHSERNRLRLSAEQEELGAALGGLSRNELLDLLAAASDRNDRKIRELAQHPERVRLTDQERAVRDMALDGLSRDELKNLLTRRLWTAVRRLTPGSKKRRAKRRKRARA